VRRVPQEDSLFAAFGENDEENLGIDSGPAEEDQHCPLNCNKPKRLCRKMHKCTGNQCKHRSSGAHWAHNVDFKYFQGGAGNRQLGCSAGNIAAEKKYAEKTKPIRERRREEEEAAAAAGTIFVTNLPQVIELGETIIDDAIDGFDGHFDMYIYVASTGARKVTLLSEAISTIFQQTNSNTPTLRTLEYDPDAPLWDNGLVRTLAERREAADDTHVFELGDTGFDMRSADALETAMQEFGQQIAAASGGRIKTLWRRRGVGGPKSGGPYKVGLLIIERNADGTLGPGKWVRIDEY